MLEKIGDIVLTDEYWDCDCEEDYIKPVSMKHCEKCGADWDEGPSSRLDEVLAMKLPVEDMTCPENEPQKPQRQFTKATLPILEVFEQRLFEFHQEADLADIIPRGFRHEWASALDRLQMILMAARTLCREVRQEFDHAQIRQQDKVAELEKLCGEKDDSIKRLISERDEAQEEAEQLEAICDQLKNALKKEETTCPKT